MPKKRYQAALDANELSYDKMQMRVVDRLEALHSQVTQQNTIREESIVNKLTGIFHRTGKQNHNKQGLYIWGSVGRGKTYLMDIFYDCLPLDKKLRLHFHRFMQEIHHQLRDINNEEEPLKIVAESFKNRTDIICLDELFVSDIGDAMILAGLLDAFFSQGIVLVTTSNCHPKNLYKNGLQRQKFLPAIELIKQNTSIIELGGKTDHRLEYLEHADIYHHPLDENAYEIMLNNFMHVSPEPGIENECLYIEGREIQSIRCADGAVWLYFADLCDGPRSAADYIEIGRCFNTVLISETPVLTNNDDLARRFITAIDEFYDRNVKVIISAETSVHELYKGKRLSFEFQRTISRLLEMRSHDYLARPHKSL
ncbi:MAG: cell division protein ZapE [Gammaproteobacteria bacterium]|nr:cell division protein ZapE [Gammaproteobacteria bacterium]